MKNEEIQLKPLNGKSFYKKCGITINGNVSELRSYDTVVARYLHDENKMCVYGWFSFITANHINAFLKYYGFDTCNKQQLENYE